MADDSAEKIPLCRNIKILVTYTNEDGKEVEVLYPIQEGFVWIQHKRDLKPSHMETLKNGGEVKVGASVEVKVTFETMMKGT